MFYYVEGPVTYIQPHMAVVDCGGVGYACATTDYTLSHLEQGKKAKLYTYLHVREEIFELYGFYTQEELNTFKMLLGISGVGPKAALAILSSVVPEQLAAAIVTGEEKVLTAVPGIGKKIAQRIILELKDKLAKEPVVLSGVAMENRKTTKAQEAAEALQVLGYSPQEISNALKGLAVEQMSLEEIIRQSLRGMMKG